MYIFERDVDWASSLLSPLTYEGLLDEVFGIRYRVLHIGLYRISGRIPGFICRVSSWPDIR